MGKPKAQLIYEALRTSLSAQVKAVGYINNFIAVTVDGEVVHLKVVG